MLFGDSDNEMLPA